MVIEFAFQPWALALFVVVVLALLGLAAWLGYRLGGRRGGMWRRALGRLPLGVALFRNGSQPTFANEPARELLPQLEAAPLEQARRMAATGLSQSAVVRGGDGLVVQVQSVPLGGPESAVLLALRDIGQQQEAEASYRKLIHTLSHEVLTPLTAIQESCARFLVARGFCETISYSFVHRDLQQQLYPEQDAWTLLNPISSDLSAMRLGLWPGLLSVALHNLHRQQESLRLFETGI
ncbi:MAG: hypothetical protein MUD01_13330, partial [Chloroflexaceae bacterium]|nr:hypothetical protein [Chloroflexaceae bacterium]